jgi:hypothetical protein
MQRGAMTAARYSVSQPFRTELRLTWVMSQCAELEALREDQKRMTAVWGRHLHPDSALRLEANFAMDLAVRLLDRHRYWCAKCRNRAKESV